MYPNTMASKEVGLKKKTRKIKKNIFENNENDIVVNASFFAGSKC